MSGISRMLNLLTRDGKIFLLVTLLGVILTIAGIICFILVNARVGGALLAPGLCFSLTFGLAFLCDTSMLKQRGRFGRGAR